MPSQNEYLLEGGADLIPLINNADINGAATTGDWLKLRDYTRVGIYVAKFGSEDLDDTSIQFLQGTDATGAGSKALSLPANRPIYYKTGTLTAQTVWTKTSVTSDVDGIAVGASVPSGSTRVVADLNTATLLLYTELLATDLDVDNQFDWMTVYIGNNCNNACLVTVTAIPRGGRFPQAVPLSAIS